MKANDYICSMNKIQPHIKLRAIFFVLVLLSVISTLHIISNYHSGLLMNESVSFFNMTDSVKIKEVGIVDFVVEAFRRVVVTLM